VIVAIADIGFPGERYIQDSRDAVEKKRKCGLGGAHLRITRALIFPA
jgi:hypothetical protein